MKNLTFDSQQLLATRKKLLGRNIVWSLTLGFVICLIALNSYDKSITSFTPEEVFLVRKIPYMVVAFSVMALFLIKEKVLKEFRIETLRARKTVPWEIGLIHVFFGAIFFSFGWFVAYVLLYLIQMAV